MSAAPPPPPVFSPPSGSAGVWDRRALREHRRAAARVAKQQRAMYRTQLRAMRRRSLLPPLLIIGVGVVFLLIQSGQLPVQTALTWFARWWPAVPIAAGLVLLAEWSLDTWISANRAGQAAPLPQRRLGAGGVLLLLLLTGMGVAVGGLQTHTDWLQGNWASGLSDTWGLEQIFAPRSEVELELSAPLSPGALLRVQNHRGSITVTGASQDGQVHVVAHQRLWTWPPSGAHRRQQRNQPTLERDDSGLLLSVPGDGRDQTELTIQMPHQSALTVARETGDLTVSELRGPVSIEDHSGNIALTALTGRVLLSSRDNNASISAHSLSGPVTLEGKSGDLAFSDITGPLSLHGDFFGTSHLERITGSVHFQSSYTDLTCAGVDGELDVQGRRDLQGRRLTGPITLLTTDRNLTLSEVRGPVTVTDRNGSVDLSLAALAGPVTVSTTGAAIHLQLPEKSGFTLNAGTANGQITSNLSLTPEQSGSHISLAGQVLGGGPAVRLQTSDGDIHLHAGREETQDAEDAGP